MREKFLTVCGIFCCLKCVLIADLKEKLFKQEIKIQVEIAEKICF